MPTLTIAKKDYKVTKGNIVKMYDKATKQEFENGLDLNLPNRTPLIFPAEPFVVHRHRTRASSC